MKKVIVIFILTLLIPVTSVKGYYCKNSEVARYKGLASNISITYDYVEKDHNVTFSITLSNLKPDLYIVDASTDLRYNYVKDELTIDGYKPSQKVKFNVYPTNPDCSNNLLYTIMLELPGYNPYYDDPICDGIGNYIYCQKWYSHNLNHNSFYVKVSNYKYSLKPTRTDEEQQETNSLLLLVLKFWSQYYYIISPIVIVIGSAGVIIINKKSDIYN